MEHITATAYRPQTNGALERMHRTFKQCLDKHKDKDTEWDLLTKYILFAIREAPNSSTGFSPYQLLYGRQPRGPLAVLADSLGSTNTLKGNVRQQLDTLRENLQVATAIASKEDGANKEKRKQVFDLQAKAKPLEVGDNVLLRSPQPGKMNRVEWLGPYQILDRPSEVTYTLNLPTRMSSKKVVHRNALKPYKAQINRCVIAQGSDKEGVLLEPPLNPGDKPRAEPLNIGEISDHQMMMLRRLLNSYEDVLDDSPSKDADVEAIQIQTTSDYPISLHPYPIPDNKLPAVKQEIQELLQQTLKVPLELSSGNRPKARRESSTMCKLSKAK